MNAPTSSADIEINPSAAIVLLPAASVAVRPLLPGAGQLDRTPECGCGDPSVTVVESVAQGVADPLALGTLLCPGHDHLIVRMNDGEAALTQAEVVIDSLRQLTPTLITALGA
jgi:hypothetical protein